MVYAECGIDYFTSGSGDPYLLPSYGRKHRDLFKKVMLAALNAASRTKAKSAIQSEVNKRTLALPSGKSVEDILSAFEMRHSPILTEFYSDRALHYQFLDSEVAARVLEYFTRTARDPVLCMHDSFIIDEAWKDLLEEKMAEALVDLIAEHTALKAVTSKITDTQAWRRYSSPVTYTGSLSDVVASPDVRRQQDWYRTKRQGVLIHSPPSP